MCAVPSPFSEQCPSWSFLLVFSFSFLPSNGSRFSVASFFQLLNEKGKRGLNERSWTTIKLKKISKIPRFITLELRTTIKRALADNAVEYCIAEYSWSSWSSCVMRLFWLMAANLMYLYSLQRSFFKDQKLYVSTKSVAIMSSPFSCCREINVFQSRSTVRSSYYTANDWLNSNNTTVTMSVGRQSISQWDKYEFAGWLCINIRVLIPLINNDQHYWANIYIRWVMEGL